MAKSNKKCLMTLNVVCLKSKICNESTNNHTKKVNCDSVKKKKKQQKVILKKQNTHTLYDILTANLEIKVIVFDSDSLRFLFYHNVAGRVPTLVDLCLTEMSLCNLLGAVLLLEDDCVNMKERRKSCLGTFVKEG